MPPFAPLPTFWSDQHDCRIQAIGAPALGTADTRILEGTVPGDVIVGHYREGALIAVVGVGGPRTVAATARYRAVLEASRAGAMR